MNTLRIVGLAIGPVVVALAAIACFVGRHRPRLEDALWITVFGGTAVFGAALAWTVVRYNAAPIGTVCGTLVCGAAWYMIERCDPGSLRDAVWEMIGYVGLILCIGGIVDLFYRVFLA